MNEALTIDEKTGTLIIRWTDRFTDIEHIEMYSLGDHDNEHSD